MACTSCSTKDGQPKGCKNNGTCGTDSCNKLTVFDWLSNMSVPNGEKPFDFVEVRFKNGRKHYYKNTESLSLSIGDVVATEAQSGHDIGVVTLTGELVRVQMKRKKASQTGDEVQKIYRKASQKDIDIWSDARDREEPMKVKARQFAIDLNLQMKISDIEFQGDASKATFYYTAEDRVDFRELIKLFAKEFRTRIEMKQIGFRQEAARLGGIGSCGRELCCSTWLTDFRSVSTSAARYQQLSLNPQKLAGQCGKLKCCLNYELDSYLDALKAFPKTDIKLYTEKGTAVCQKTDIFKGHMWYAYEGEWMNWHKITTDQAREIIELNRKKEKVESLEEYASDLVEEAITTEFENVVGQDSLTRFDSPKGPKKRKNTKGRNTKNKNTRKPAARTDAKTSDKPKAAPSKPRKRQEVKGEAKTANKPKPRPKQRPKPRAKTDDKAGATDQNKGPVKKPAKRRPKPNPSKGNDKGRPKTGGSKDVKGQDNVKNKD
ncbi:regulatory iron-sulfur-containing complex subunit RicT [Bizionia paragorgiae]|uniref:Cell fate regulator YaaT, PSP1 superfamily (Controls sporulation, competence, biofilm development) n=1 Tax=Bizionia paragorgiae TaxID=283786 RepID=A0A1H3VZD2_BIZPA|nr:regulatory iron-sulfur-containing complex subunit RicT [Bizionia paragorgiae]SDZ80041.1 Cell fate regulator YaaT, PSP1 superfamily (controls sporulation, competence, biofilm development) [Bizionia paragorgiae]